jgi:hypothetical protein
VCVNVCFVFPSVMPLPTSAWPTKGAQSPSDSDAVVRVVDSLSGPSLARCSRCAFVCVRSKMCAAPWVRPASPSRG